MRAALRGLPHRSFRESAKSVEGRKSLFLTCAAPRQGGQGGNAMHVWPQKADAATCSAVLLRG
jgi:hypothetical protein